MDSAVGTPNYKKTSHLYHLNQLNIYIFKNPYDDCVYFERNIFFFHLHFSVYLSGR